MRRKESPQVHLEVECRLDTLQEFRARLNTRGLAYGGLARGGSAHGGLATRVSLLDCVVKALALALVQTPEANVARAGGGYEPARRADVAHRAQPRRRDRRADFCCGG